LLETSHVAETGRQVVSDFRASTRIISTSGGNNEVLVMKWSIGLVLVLVACASTGANLQSESCATDEAASHRDLVAYRSQLLAALDSRRLDRVKPMVRDDVRVSVESTGWSEFVKQNHLTDPRAEGWGELASLLRLGGRLTGPDEFCAPAFACPPDYGGPTAGLIRVAMLDKGIWALAEPSASGARVRQLSCEVLPVGGEGLEAPPPDTLEWMTVWLPERRWAYVPRRSIVFVDSYLLIDRRQGVWRLAATLGGYGLTAVPPNK
jgi:hypothetical protein